MGVRKIRRNKPKPRPKPVINYPPVPTKKWIPPDKRKKPPKPEPRYIKPEGITQKLAISSLKKVWHQYDVYEDAAVLTGHFSQSHKRFTFKSNGLQGACNSALACVYSQIYKMSSWTKNLLDEILVRGDELFVRSTQQGDKCLTEISPDKMDTNFFLGNRKITLFVNITSTMKDELTSASEEKAKQIIGDVITKFLGNNESGIFSLNEKYTAIWIKDEVYYYFDPEDHDVYGNPWMGVSGCGVSLLGRFKTIATLVDYLYKNFPGAKGTSAKFHVVPCGIARIVNINTTPPETFEEVKPVDVVFTKIIEQPPPLPDKKLLVLQSYVEEDKEPADPTIIKIQEMSPDVRGAMSESKRPSFLPEGPVQKFDSCRFPVPVPTYLKGEHARLTYYTELIPKSMGILRGSTCQTNPNFSKYLGRQSMGNALSALIMLRLCKSKHWIPKLVDNILRYGDLLYRDAMVSIPRSRSLRLTDFPKKIEYEGKNFTPDVDEYAAIGQMQSQDYDILDLGPALDEFLADHDCCIIQGPQILAVWIEDGVYYMFDPNERDQEGKAIIKTAIVGTNVVNLENPTGVACVVWCDKLKNLVNLYIDNTEKARRDERFYLSKVVIKDFLTVSKDWFNFKGIDIGKWILRGTFSQASLRFSPESRNTQGTANAFVALALAILFDEQEWTSDTVDEILMSGDKFYLETVEQLQEKGLFTNPRLMISELNKRHRVRDKEAEFELEECIVNGLINAKDQNDVYNLRKGLEVFFKDRDYGVVTTREISLPIWKKKELYFYLDPYSRDEKGVITGYGTSCAIRFQLIDDLAESIEANLDPNTEDFFNISNLKITLYEAGEEGGVKPPLNNYEAISNKSAILRSWLSERDEKYEIRKGRQTVPMCVTAAGFNKLKPAAEWTKNDMDSILDKGDSLYVESMSDAQKELDANEPEFRQETPVDIEGGGDAKAAPPKPPQEPKPEGEVEEQDEISEEIEEEEEEEAEVEIKITSENTKPEFRIGPNNISIELSDIAEGNIRESLRDSLRAFFEEEQADDESNKEALLETKHYTVALWKDDKAYYVFDPRPRDKNGEVIGKDDWDPEPPEPESEPEEEAAEGAENPDDEGAFMNEEEEEEDDEFETEMRNVPISAEVKEENEDEDEGEKNIEVEALYEEGSEVEEQEEEKPLKPKKSPSYWKEQEKSGRACTVWFTDLNDFVTFVYENIPVRDRLKTDFSLKGMNVTNNLMIKSKYNPEDERPDVYAGDWYDFKEVEKGKWIIRATLDLTHELFPAKNRGQQGLTCSVIALGIAHLYEITCFTHTVPDAIIVYGDKLLTFMKRSRKKQLMQDANTNLKEDEVDWLIEHEEFKVTDIPKRICVSKFMVEVSVTPDVIVGDTKAQDFEDVLDVPRGLVKFFEDARYGVMFAKDVYVAVWRGEKMYYMFDGMKRGPSGLQSAFGTGCLTRYLELEKLADVFVQNLPVLGKSEFVIHKLDLSRNLCPREREPKKISVAPKAVSKSAGLKMVIPGKCIIRGTIHQEDPKFGKGPNAMSAPIAVIALTMSLIHKPEIWSRPIIDDIVIIGSELYEDSVNQLGFGFNPWEDKLDVYSVQNDYKLGMIRANCELRNTDQRGLIDVKDPGKQNLRQGIEHFFEENTHGILITEPFTVAIWEQKQEEGDPLIYIFDPNPRSSTGMPLFTGTACALSFVNAKLASDHIIGCILDPAQRAGEFIIVPVEIVISSARTVIKQPEKSPTRSSINVLPRCSKSAAQMQKRKLRKLAEEDRKRKAAKKQQLIGRTGYYIKGAEAILRGYKSQNSETYSPDSRNKQDIPNCIASVVLHSLLPIDGWNYRNIDLILDTGNQLYIDSYIAYGPKNPKLGMENVLRKFFIGTLEVHVTVYKPIITAAFTVNKLSSTLEALFQQETISILNYKQDWISLFFKGGFYFMFDPHARNIEGSLIKNKESGSSVVVRFDSLNAMALKIVQNLDDKSDDESSTFQLWLISVESK